MITLLSTEDRIPSSLPISHPSSVEEIEKEPEPELAPSPLIEVSYCQGTASALLHLTDSSANSAVNGRDCARAAVQEETDPATSLWEERARRNLLQRQEAQLRMTLDHAELEASDALRDDRECISQLQFALFLASEDRRRYEEFAAADSSTSLTAPPLQSALTAGIGVCLPLSFSIKKGEVDTTQKEAAVAELQQAFPPGKLRFMLEEVTLEAQRLQEKVDSLRKQIGLFGAQIKACAARVPLFAEERERILEAGKNYQKLLRDRQAKAESPKPVPPVEKKPPPEKKGVIAAVAATLWHLFRRKNANENPQTK